MDRLPRSRPNRSAVRPSVLTRLRAVEMVSGQRLAAVIGARDRDAGDLLRDTLTGPTVNSSSPMEIMVM